MAAQLRLSLLTTQMSFITTVMFKTASTIISVLLTEGKGFHLCYQSPVTQAQETQCRP